MELPEKRIAFGRWEAFALVRIRSRKGPLSLSRSCKDALVNFRRYVNLGKTLCRSTDHMVLRVAFFLAMVYLTRAICCLIVGR